MTLPFSLQGEAIAAPMTKGSNLPYRRLCVELGARVLVSEMVVARRLKQRRRSEFALIRRAPDEPCFGVQLAGNKPDELAWAAALVEARGAHFVDLNLGSPIDHFTRKGLGAALARQPTRVRRIVEANHATNARVFGSVATGEDIETSDIDILVDPTSETTLFDIGAIRNELGALLGVPVDVLTPNALPSRIRGSVLARAVPV